MPEVKGFSQNQWIIAAFLFFLSFGVIVAMNAAREATKGIPVIGPFFDISSPLPWESSPMFFVMPIVAFFLIFFLVDWVNKYFETSYALHPIFPALFFGLGLLAFYVALFWYNANFSQLAGIDTVEVDFWGKIRNNAYFLFIWGGVFGWIARFASEKIKL